MSFTGNPCLRFLGKHIEDCSAKFLHKQFDNVFQDTMKVLQHSAEVVLKEFLYEYLRKRLDKLL